MKRKKDLHTLQLPRLKHLVLLLMAVVFETGYVAHTDLPVSKELFLPATQHLLPGTHRMEAESQLLTITPVPLNGFLFKAVSRVSRVRSWEYKVLTSPSHQCFPQSNSNSAFRYTNKGGVKNMTQHIKVSRSLRVPDAFVLLLNPEPSN